MAAKRRRFNPPQHRFTRVRPYATPVRSRTVRRTPGSTPAAMAALPCIRRVSPQLPQGLLSHYRYSGPSTARRSPAPHDIAKTLGDLAKVGKVYAYDPPSSPHCRGSSRAPRAPTLSRRPRARASKFNELFSLNDRTLLYLLTLLQLATRRVAAASVVVVESNCRCCSC